MAGEDPLTNRHANTTFPEVHGAARAYEVTGDDHWREIAEVYWRCAVTDGGCFCTGGQTNGEIWTPPFKFSARLGDKNQEHCTVYNIMRLADYLLRWTGDVAYTGYKVMRSIQARKAHCDGNPFRYRPYERESVCCQMSGGLAPLSHILHEKSLNEALAPMGIIVRNRDD